MVCRLLFLLLISCSSLLKAGVLTSDPGLPYEVNQIVNTFADELKQSGMSLVAKNMEIDECTGLIGHIDLLVETDNTRLTIPQARVMIVAMVFDFLQKINEDPKTDQYFSDFPVWINNIGLQIRVRYDRCNPLYPPVGNIAYITLADEWITYSTYNTFTGMLDFLRRESYTQAIDLIYSGSRSQK